MINEPKAAILAYALEFKENQKECAFNLNQEKQHIIIIDFGGGTLDITLLEFNNEDKAEYIVILYLQMETRIKIKLKKLQEKNLKKTARIYFSNLNIK